MNLFSKVKAQKPGYNKFDLSHERKFSLNMGSLIPIFLSEVLPGDSFRVNSEVMMRFAPMLAPVMHRVNVYIHYFHVPNRLVWDEWPEFITGGDEGSTPPVMPHWINDGDAEPYLFKGSLADYMGYPVTGAGATTDPIAISALPFRAYQLIYNEFYRDQNLSAEVPILKTSGQVTNSEMFNFLTMRTRAWEKDYFTSALPWAQKGGDVSLPVDSEATVEYKTVSDVLRDDGTPEGINTLLGVGPTDAGKLRSGKINNTTTGWAARIENIANVIIDSTSVTINALRQAVQLQKWLEANARGGSRYIESILSHFGVVSSDARLQRPEYLGGSKTPCVISEVLSTFQQADGEGNPQANMAGHGISVGNQSGFKRRFEEHGYVIGIMSVLPRTAYQQGIPRHFRRMDKLDFYWPLFANLGEQEIKQSEIYYDGAAPDGTADTTFGYTPRYAEYKYIPTTVHGEFRDSLAFWHMGRIFDSAPQLNNQFVESDPTTRIFAVDDPGQEHLYCQIYNRVDAIRPMPYYGTPKF